jgi:hypothetical protein
MTELGDLTVRLQILNLSPSMLKIFKRCRLVRLKFFCAVA